MEVYKYKEKTKIEEKKEETMTIQELKTFLGSLQDSEGKFISENSIKATAEYLLVHRLCPEIGVGDTEKAETFLVNQLPCFAFWEVSKGFKSMEKIWQIAVGIPDTTSFLSERFLDLSLSVPIPVKSSLLLALFLQKVENKLIEGVLKDVVAYQETLFKTVSLDTLYETTHNIMTFKTAQKYNVTDIIHQGCTWLSENIFLYKNCIDLVAETVAVTLLCSFVNERITKMLSVIIDNQNKDGGLPVFAGGKSEFHSSLVGLWALTAARNTGFVNY